MDIPLKAFRKGMNNEAFLKTMDFKKAPTELPRDVIRFIKLMLNWEPGARPTAREAQKIIRKILRMDGRESACDSGLSSLSDPDQ